jgi:hypothetical protein
MRRFAFLAIMGGLAVAGCGSSDSYKSQDYDIGAQVLNLQRNPVPGVQVQVWIVNVDLPGSERTPIAMNPRITTNSAGMAIWTYQAHSEPTICGYLVLDSEGNTLRDETPHISKDFGPQPSLVTITVDR